MPPDYDAIARRHKPKGIKIRWRCDGELSPAHACIERREILSPKLNSRSALYVFLHEAGHLSRGFSAWEGTPRHEYEFAAEQYAIAAMRKEGVPIPRATMREAKRDVREWCAADESKGIKIRPDIARWANFKRTCK